MKTARKLVPLALGTALFTGCISGEIGAGAAGQLDDERPSAVTDDDVGDDAGDTGGIHPGGSPGGGVPTGPAEPETTSALGCDDGRVYRGIGGRVLVSTRVDQLGTVDRRRIKPFSALQTEFPRVLGNTPALLAQSAATFGAPAERWYEESQASAVTLFTSFRVGFQGCLALTATAPEYAGAPTPSSAAAVCTALAKRFWSREPEAAELDACVQVAVADTASEANARRRWAYACATLLSTSGFLSY